MHNAHGMPCATFMQGHDGRKDARSSAYLLTGSSLSECDVSGAASLLNFCNFYVSHLYRSGCARESPAARSKVLLFAGMAVTCAREGVFVPCFSETRRYFWFFLRDAGAKEDIFTGGPKV